MHGCSRPRQQAASVTPAKGAVLMPLLTVPVAPPPHFSTQAQATLVRSFKRLRGDDAAPGSHSAYRITVRQLEALVRLSEATARVFLSPVVNASHVAEVSAALEGGWLGVIGGRGDRMLARHHRQEVGYCTYAVCSSIWRVCF